jgi:hypothetical protein
VTLAAGNGTAFWYLTRGSGTVALLLLTAGLVLGILGTVRWRSDRWPRFAVVAIHRNLTLFAVVFVAIHVLSTIVDGYAPIGLKDVIIPFFSRYRPLWLGFGALAFDLLVALIVTSFLRVRIGYRSWRAVHWLAYASWPFALVHGLGSGSDARFGWFALVTLACAGAVAAAVIVRIARSSAQLAPRAAAGVLTAVLAVLAIAWYRTGPARSGWAARAGTPKSLLHRSVGTSAASTDVSTKVPRSFDGALQGRFARSSDNVGDLGIAFGASVRGRVPAILRMTLWGTAAGEGVSLSESRVTFEPVGGGSFTGTIVGLQGTDLTAAVADASGRRLQLTISLNINFPAGTFTGSVHGVSASGE